MLFEASKLVLNISLQYLLLTDADLIFQRPLYVCICICKGHHLPFGKQNRIHKHVCKYLLTSNSKKHHSSQIINVGSIKSKNSFFSRHITTKKEMLPNDSYNFHFDSYFKGQNVQNIDDTYISVYLCDIFISFPRLYEAMNSKM